MPRGDGTGPLGRGPMTGGGWGWCAGYPDRGYGGRAGAGPGRGFGRGAGFGRGGGGGRSGYGRGWRTEFLRTGLPGWARGRWAGPPPIAESPTLEKQALQEEAAALQAELDRIKARLGELEGAGRQEQP
ncbi:MAG TPA: DUF5320 domain-containing protein [Vicinamibacterales bacterium]|nr:DUF5320 domain-containing protein [Vicinamibacterales bacterium]